MINQQWSTNSTSVDHLAVIGDTSLLLRSGNHYDNVPMQGLVRILQGEIFIGSIGSCK